MSTPEQREANNRRVAAWAARDPEHARELRRQAQARYRAKDPEKHRSRAAAWRAANPERAREASRRADAKRDPERTRLNSRERRLRRRQVVDQLKSGPCTDCGGSYPPYVMHFDHRDPATKLFNIGHQVTVSLERILAEIEKCDLVCANCHAERTWGPKKVQVHSA